MIALGRKHLNLYLLQWTFT